MARIKQTPKQFIASMRRCKECPEDLRYQVSVWPWPQENQSCIDIWRESWPREFGRLPDGYIQVQFSSKTRPADMVKRLLAREG